MSHSIQVILFFFLLGAGVITVIAVNVWHIDQRKAKADDIPDLSQAVKVAWKTSFGSILMPYVAPVALMIKVWAFLKAKNLNEIENNKTGLILAVVNSTWAILFAVMVLTLGLELLRK